MAYDKPKQLTLTQNISLVSSEIEAKALEAYLSGHGQYKVFYSHRYLHPMSAEVASLVKEFSPDMIILLPLYPQLVSNSDTPNS